MDGFMAVEPLGPQPLQRILNILDCPGELILNNGMNDCVEL